MIFKMCLQPLMAVINASSPRWCKWLESFEMLDIKIIDVGDFAELLFRFVLNMLMLLLIVRFVYLKHSNRRNFTFSYLAVGGVVFLLCFLLNSVKLELGFALGLFAIFGIIRYRTDGIPFKDMTYLFVVIGISVINALANKKVSYTELLFTNAVIFAGLWCLEKFLSARQEGSMKIIYENINNVKLENYENLLLDLRNRTGFDVKHFEVKKIDYLKDIAIIVIYFNVDENNYPPKSSNGEICV